MTPAGTLRPGWTALGLLGILLMALALRAPFVDFGLPAGFHPDETGATEQVSTLLTGKTVLDAYKHPPLLRNLTWAGLKTLQSATHPKPFSSPAVTLGLRWVSLLAGLAGVWATYAVATRLVGRSLALLPALFYACLPLTVFSSIYGTPDMLVSALVALGLWSALQLYERPTVLRYGVAGLLVALAIGAKYPGGLVGLSVLAAHGLSPRRPATLHATGRVMGACVAGFAAGIVVSFPFLITEAPAMLRDLRFEFSHLLTEGHRGIRVSGRSGGCASPVCARP